MSVPLVLLVPLFPFGFAFQDTLLSSEGEEYFALLWTTELDSMYRGELRQNACDEYPGNCINYKLRIH